MLIKNKQEKNSCLIVVRRKNNFLGWIQKDKQQAGMSHSLGCHGHLCGCQNETWFNKSFIFKIKLKLLVLFFIFNILHAYTQGKHQAQSSALFNKRGTDDKSLPFPDIFYENLSKLWAIAYRVVRHLPLNYGFISLLCLTVMRLDFYRSFPSKHFGVLNRTRFHPTLKKIHKHISSNIYTYSCIYTFHQIFTEGLLFIIYCYRSSEHNIFKNVRHGKKNLHNFLTNVTALNSIKFKKKTLKKAIKSNQEKIQLIETTLR